MEEFWDCGAQLKRKKMNDNWNLSSYDYQIAEELIAQRPLPKRGQSRLLIYNAQTEEVHHTHFHNLPEWLSPETLVVFNRSKVFPCRLEGNNFEIMLLSLKEKNGSWQCLIRSGKKKNLGHKYPLKENKEAKIERVNGDGTFQVSFGPDNRPPLEQAAVPIPPYIRQGRADERDFEDYQTCYAREVGSVAAPTAGLHFEQTTLRALEEKGIESAQVILHVGPGTFAPVKTEDIRNHSMHSEEFLIDRENLEKIDRARTHQKKIFAVGTTSLRVLESIYNKTIQPGIFQSTDLYLYPGTPVKSIDGLITNFHRPCSSLLMLVSALIGREKVLQLYSLAIEKKYRFFSYGDAMLIISPRMTNLHKDAEEE